MWCQEENRKPQATFMPMPLDCLTITMFMPTDLFLQCILFFFSKKKFKVFLRFFYPVGIRIVCDSLDSKGTTTLNIKKNWYGNSGPIHAHEWARWDSRETLKGVTLFLRSPFGVFFSFKARGANSKNPNFLQMVWFRSVPKNFVADLTQSCKKQEPPAQKWIHLKS